MHDVRISWTKSPSPDTAKYRLQWFVAGLLAKTMLIAKTTAGDANGYSRLYSTDFAGSPLGDGVEVYATIAALDGSNNISPLITTPVVTTPDSPPEAPENPGAEYVPPPSP
jgi:hypothetical protein